jgi:hypothetical protein
LAWILGFLGATLGASTAAALLLYDGSQPVNVLAWLFYLGLLPVLMLLPLAVGLMLPAGWVKHVGPAQALLASVIRPLLRRLPKSDSWFSRFFGTQGRPLYIRLHKWLIVGLSQGFATAILAGALLALLIKVTLSDLTFAWSTTLDVTPDHVHALVETVALPWSGVFPQAVPSPEIIDATQFERYLNTYMGPATSAVESASTQVHVDGATTIERQRPQPAATAAWWQFCLMVTLVYGFLPRVLLLVLARWRWRVALEPLPQADRAEAVLLLKRLAGATAGFRRRSDQPEQPPTPLTSLATTAQAAADPAATASSTPANAPTFLIAWGAAGEDLPAVRKLIGDNVPADSSAPDDGRDAHQQARWLAAGCSIDVEADDKVLAEAAAHQGPVTVLIPLAEPPVHEVLAFLRGLIELTPQVNVQIIDASAGNWQAVPLNDHWHQALASLPQITVLQA